MDITLLLLAVVLAAASVVPLLREEAWWIRVFDFPRAQIFVLGVIVIVLSLLYADIRDWQGFVALCAAAAAVLIQAANIFPYTPLAPKEVLSADAADAGRDHTLSLLVANVLMDNRRAESLRRMIAERAPDIVLLLEPDAWWQAQMRALKDDGYVHTLEEARDNKYGMLLYSRLPLLDPEIRYLLKDGVPSMHVQIRLRSGRDLRFSAVHPEPPAPSEAETSLPRDAELLMVGREVREQKAPTVVAGDLNDVAWSHTTRLFQKTSRLLDPRKGRGMFNTFHAKLPLLRWPLDHVFHSDHFLLADMQRLPAFGSDHFPVYVRLVLQPEAAQAQEAPWADADDAQAADRKIAEARCDT
ncbi:MAG TPA: endonuclease/exonuclease/phosphatase family protein [Gammaproteobacteria bacterium]